jgi:tRNA G18 (ribose-2'-O)-methylase SpoU
VTGDGGEDDRDPLRVPFRATAAAEAWDAVGPLPVTVLLDNVRSLYNVGAFFRTADAVGITGLVLAGITAAPPHARLAKTALGAERAVPWRHASAALDEVTRLRQAGVHIAAIETGIRAVDLFEWRPPFPVCVVFGHEVEGVTPPVLDAADVHVRIPTRGSKHSLNVATAGGVVLYELLRKYRALGGHGRR